MELLKPKSEQLWSVWRQRDGVRTDCSLLDHGEHGIDVELAYNGEWYYGHRHATRGLALAEADAKLASLQKDGWMLLPAVDE